MCVLVFNIIIFARLFLHCKLTILDLRARYQLSKTVPLTAVHMCVQVTYTIMLNQLQVHLPACQDFNTEFSITSNVRSCTLRARYCTAKSFK